ncbi:MAG: hypothetical protein IKK59_05755 [Lachnospiraceae bacterium]|nr:hypothetical protein [Lachnospiraceae bacterium]
MNENLNIQTKKCKHCQSDIPKKAKVCPNCRKKQGGILKWFLIVFVALVIIGAASGGEDDKQPKEVTNSQPTPIEGTTNLTEKETTDEQKYTTYEASTYKVGSDIPAGEYVVYADNFMGYAEVSSDSSGKLESIITNNNFSYNMIITIEDGQYFKLTGCYAVPLEENPPVDASGEGTFKIGTHLQAGEYKIEVAKNNSVGYGYVQVSSDSTGSLKSIITNDNFEGSKYITVSDGQYLTLSGCHIAK